MAHWESRLGIVRWPTVDCPDYPGWEIVDCGCCAGILWGGEQPKECKRCGGNGIIYRHKKSKVTALYPGGPFT